MDFNNLINEFESKGWTVCLDDAAEWVDSRYSDLPSDLKEFLSSFKSIESPDGKEWFLSAYDFQQKLGTDFSSDEFEKMSLNAAQGDPEWQKEIRGFWDKHLPFYMSVKNGYEYMAINLKTGKFVRGSGPEFEELIEISNSLSAAIESLAHRKEH